MDVSCFDISGMELVKKKYYNAAKVGELLESVLAEEGIVSVEEL